MAIRLRQVDGTLIALCAVETDEMPGDVYLDDGQHYALSAKFWRDYQGETINFTSEEDDRLAETQKVRDAKEEAEKWVQNNPARQRETA